MAHTVVRVAPIRRVGLLERAIAYALGGDDVAISRSLSSATPCSNWDLGMLLHHTNDSLTALHEGIETGCVGDGRPDEPDPAADPVAGFRDRARRLLGAWTAAGEHDRMLIVAELPLAASTAALIGAIEIAVHAWDISWACGRPRPIPPALALDLLKISRRVVDSDARDLQFAAEVPVSPMAAPSDRLVAFLGRRPRA
jgi:uncharacterized protein (TIGR03086 family)